MAEPGKLRLASKQNATYIKLRYSDLKPHTSIREKEVHLLFEVTNGDGKCKLSLIKNQASTVIKIADLVAHGSEIEVRTTSFQVEYKVSSFFVGEPIPLEVCSDYSLLIQEGSNSQVFRPGCSFLTFKEDKILTISHLKR